MTHPDDPQQALSQTLGTAGRVVAALEALHPRLDGPEDTPIAGVAGLSEAGPHDLTFIRSEAYAAKWPETRAGVALVTRGVDVPGHDPARRALIYVDSADHALAALLDAAARLAPAEPAEPGVHPAATVHPEAEVHPEAAVGPGATIGPRASLAAHARVHAGAVVGSGVRLGVRTVIHPRAALMPGVVVGEDCTIHPGAVLGADGFGFLPSPAADGGFIKVPHLAGVEIGDHAEIGANACVDRGKFRHTTIGRHTKIDNLVQVGHSCTIGDRVRICGCTAIGGSTTIGDDVLIGGACAISDNIAIAPRSILGGGTHVAGDITSPGAYAGFPAKPAAHARRVFAAQSQLPKLRDRLAATFRDIHRRLDRLEHQDGHSA